MTEELPTEKIRVNPDVPNKYAYISKPIELILDKEYREYARAHVEPKDRETYLNEQKIFLLSPEGKEFQKFKEPSAFKVIHGINVYFMDGQALRNKENGFLDYTMGGHGNRYIFIPQDEIWIESNLKNNPVDVEAVLWHEYGEMLWMAEGQSYAEAHSRATWNEKDRRSFGRHILPVGTYRQSEPGLCGPGSAVPVGWFLREKHTEADYNNAFGGNPVEGTTPQQMVEGFKKLGLGALSKQHLEVETVKKLVRTGFPIIANHWTNVDLNTDEGHYATIVGYDEKKNVFIISDPAENTGYVERDIDDFMKMWYEKDDHTEREGILAYKGELPEDIVDIL